MHLVGLVISHRSKLIGLALSLSCLLLTRTASATDVTIRLVNQDGQLIAASQFSVIGVPGTIVQNAVISLAPGDHTVRVFPGILGFAQGGTLFRDEPITVGSSPQTVELVWVESPFAFSIIDQDLQLIPGSKVDLQSLAGGVIDNGFVISLPVTEDPSSPVVQGTIASGYVVRSRVAILGTVPFAGAGLFRQHAPLELTDAGIDFIAVWPHATLTVDVVDQTSTDIPGSRIDVRSATAGLPGGVFASGSSIALPVTDDPNPPAIQGSLASGYTLRAAPGILGADGLGQLFRDHPPLELSGDTVVDLVWPLASLTLHLVDQDGLLIPSSILDLRVTNGIVANGATVLLPITDDPGGPSIQGPLSLGYSVRSLPGINGVAQAGQLFRDHPADELAVTGSDRAIEWDVAQGTLHVVDSGELEVDGASILLPTFLGEIPTGTSVALPLNDDALYPSLQGALAVGYPISLRPQPASPPSGPFSFEILTGNSISPPFVSIDGQAFGLRFNLQPTVDLDGDGFATPDDCDDTDPTVYPGAPDLPGDTVDQDCDGILSCDPGATYRNHGHFVSCVAQAAQVLVDAGSITEDQMDGLVAAATQSDVGKKN